MIVVYHGIRPFEQSRHLGLLDAYGKRIPVVYVDPLNVTARGGQPGPVPGGRALPNLEHAGVYRARLRRLVPGGRIRALSLANRWLAMFELLSGVRRRANGRSVVLVAQQPDLLPTLRGLPADLTVYEVRDDYAGLAIDSVARERMARAHARMLRSSDMVLAISERLVDDIRPARPDVELTGVGVEDEFFAASEAPDASPIFSGIPRPRIGTIGNLNDRVDWELLERIAKSHPDWSVVIIGPVYRAGPTTSAAVERLRTLPNVHLPGAIEPEAMPAATAALDVCLIPYRISQAVERINPLKLYQYLAVGKPVVSTAIPAVRPFADVVAWTDTADAFVTAVEIAVRETHDAGRREARRHVASQFKWTSIADHQIAIYRRALDARGRQR